MVGTEWAMPRFAVEAQWSVDAATSPCLSDAPVLTRRGFAFRAETSWASDRNPMGGPGVSLSGQTGVLEMDYVFGIIIFVLDVWAIAQVINTDEPMNKKILWIAIIAILPILGLIIWYFMGPRSNVSL
ncbi:PLDc N-terminal domain-containing protein [Paracoccus methylarcula]|nr:PLDc N-terminal domain-containing protein [Paracoccus methylarcula]